MTDKKNTTAVETTKETTTATPEKKPVVRISMDDALAKAIRQGKTLELYRSLYKSVKDNKYYYNYNVLIVLPGVRQSYVRVSLRPDAGYISDKDKNKGIRQSANNSASYKMMNFMYDNGNGLDLELRSSKVKDRFDGSDTGAIKYEFYAICNDENGLGAEFLMRTTSPGEERFLYSALVGFGNCRCANEEDFANIPGLRDELVNMLLPGQIPDVDVEQDIE